MGSCFSGMGRVQPFLPQLLHVPVGEAEQQVPPVPAGVGGATHREVDLTHPGYIPAVHTD